MKFNKSALKFDESALKFDESALNLMNLPLILIKIFPKFYKIYQQISILHLLGLQRSAPRS